MPIPSQTFATLLALRNYTNSELIPNGMREISGEALNNALNSIYDFIVDYTVNGSLADINSTSNQVVVVNKPMTIFTGFPTSVQWDDDVQNEYYLVNATGLDIPITSGYSYTDAYEDEKFIIPLRQVVHIAKTENGNWVQVNNLGGGGSGGDLPPQAGNSGKFLATNGASSFWNAPHVSITSADFDSATECPLSSLAAFTLSIYWSDLANFIYESAGQWAALPGGGFEILIPGFDATLQDYHFEVFLKPLTP